MDGDRQEMHKAKAEAKAKAEDIQKAEAKQERTSSRCKNGWKMHTNTKQVKQKGKVNSIAAPC